MTSQTPDTTSITAELDAIRGRLDDLRVQASLGAMEVRDERDELVAAADRQLEAVKQRVAGLAEASEESFHTLTLGVEESLGLLKETVEEALDAFRGHAHSA